MHLILPVIKYLQKVNAYHGNHYFFIINVLKKVVWI